MLSKVLNSLLTGGLDIDCSFYCSKQVMMVWIFFYIILLLIECYVWLVGVLSTLLIIFTCLMLCSVNYPLYRFLGTQMLMEFARDRILQKKALKSGPYDNLLIKQPKESLWAEKKQLGRCNLIEKLCGVRRRVTAGSDVNCMDEYLKIVMRSGLNHVESTSLRAFLPGGAPLLDFLAVDVERIDCWKFPSKQLISLFQENRGLGVYMNRDVIVKEIVVGVTSEEKVKEIAEWVFKLYERDEELFPTSVISLDVQELSGTLFDFLRLAGRLPFSKNQSLRRNPEDGMCGSYYDKPQQIPVKILIGNGLSWGLIISLNLGWNGSRYVLRENVPQTALIKFLLELPVCMGLGIKSDVQNVELFFSLASGRDVKLRGFVELSVLATLAGWELESRGMTVMGVQLMGTVLNKCASVGDCQWGLRWREISASLRVYALGELKFGYVSYIVLVGVLLRDFFPDPNVVCRFIQCFQGRFVSWFAEFVVITMRNKELHERDVRVAGSRVELISAIRNRLSVDELAGAPPQSVTVWLELLGSWPSLTQGGCRYVLQARAWFLTQAAIIAREEFLKAPLMLAREPIDDDFLYSLFGMSQDSLSCVDWSEGSVAPGFMMVRPRHLEGIMCNINVDTLGSACVSRFCATAGRPQRELIYEWARMNLSEIDEFQHRLMRDSKFFKWYNTYYEPLRLMFRRTVDVDGVRIPVLDAERRRKDWAQYENENKLLLRVEEEYVIRKDRIKMISAALERGDDVERSVWRHHLPPLPLWKVKGKGHKRKRSRSRSRSRSRGRSLVQAKVDSGSEAGVYGLQSRSRRFQSAALRCNRSELVFAEQDAYPVLDDSVLAGCVDVMVVESVGGDSDTGIGVDNCLVGAAELVSGLGEEMTERVLHLMRRKKEKKGSDSTGSRADFSGRSRLGSTDFHYTAKESGSLDEVRIAPGACSEKVSESEDVDLLLTPADELQEFENELLNPSG